MGQFFSWRSALRAMALMVLVLAGAQSALAEEDGATLPPEVQSVVYEAEQLLLKKQYSAAEQTLKKHVQKQAGQPHYLVAYSLGNTLALQGKNQEARRHLASAAELSPAFTPAWQNLGKVCFDLKDYPCAGAAMLRAYESGGGKEPEQRFHAAAAFMLAKENAKALPHLEYITSGAAGSPKKEWIEAMVRVCVDLHQEQKAIAAVQRILAVEENVPQWWKLLGQLQLQRGDYRQAAAAFALTIHLTANPAREDLVLTGDICTAAEMPARATHYYDMALKQRASDDLLEKLAAAHLAAHRPDEALTVLRQLTGGKQLAGLWFNAGRALYDRGDMRGAYDAFSRCAQLPGQQGKAYLMMGYCAIHLKNREAAEAALHKAAGFADNKKSAQELLHVCATL